VKPITLEIDTTSRTEIQEWGLTLFNRSVLKQAKWNAIRKELGNTENKHCLDLGSDNGVISLLLRQRGGSWKSAELDPLAVASIQELIGEPVGQLTGSKLPYEDRAFEVIVVIDLMEHLEDDISFVSELARVLNGGGKLIVNVPHLKTRSILRRFRLLVGLTDEKHGHVRPGYDRESLVEILSPHFSRIRFHTYVGPFSELIDIAISWVLDRKKGSDKTSKGTVMTRDGEMKMKSTQRFYTVLYPFFKLFSLLDHFVPFLSGYMIVATAHRKRSSDNGTQSSAV
jgi:SAM-dependent methyltransferase